MLKGQVQTRANITQTYVPITEWHANLFCEYKTCQSNTDTL